VTVNYDLRAAHAHGAILQVSNHKHPKPMSVTALATQLLQLEADSLARTEALLGDIRQLIQEIEAEVLEFEAFLTECDEV